MRSCIRGVEGGGGPQKQLKTPQYQREASSRYLKTDKGKQALIRYKQSEKGKAAQERFIARRREKRRKKRRNDTNT